jgi:hypothetical protein
MIYYLDDNVIMFVLLFFMFGIVLLVCVFNIPLLIVIVGSSITGPIGKECADLWPRIASAANAIVDVRLWFCFGFESFSK